MLIVKNIDRVREEIREFFPPAFLAVERVASSGALGRVLSKAVPAEEDIPHFCRSTVDGWAVRAKDVFGASETFPAILKVAGEVLMGEKPSLTVAAGEAVYVPTGAWVPEGADAVVMIEHCERLLDEVLVYKAAPPGNQIVFRGDDRKEGETVLPAGSILGPKELGALAACGRNHVGVFAKPVCGIISTGDEIVPAGEPISSDSAEMRDVNHPMAAACLRQWGMEPRFFGICRDDEELIRESLLKALEVCDMVLLSGGSSAGRLDNTVKVIAGVPEAAFLTHGLAVKPGKPTILARIGQKPVIGLPGHPVSAFFIMQTVIRPICYALYGIEAPPLPYLTAAAGEKIPSNNGRDDFVAGALTNGVFTPLPLKSGLITLLCAANGYIMIDRRCEGVDKGAPVQVYLF
ncbi:MAG: molybdopterin molybdotransferase MoeA [Clostridiales bacterium]|nr:molybdopterin molybdotransferase MoeA [Clostridiales bacterium]